MRTIVKQSQRRLRNVQESDKGWLLSRSRAKVKPGGVEEELDDIEIDPQHSQQDSLHIFNKYQDIADEFLQSISTARQIHNHGQLDDYPFYCSQMGFMDYLEMEVLQITRAEKMMAGLEGQIEQLTHSIMTNNNLNYPQKMQTEFDIITKKNDSLFQFISTAIKVDDQKLQKLFQQQFQTLTKLNQVLDKQNKFHTEMKVLENRFQIKQKQFQSKFIQWQRAKNNLLLNKFQTAIIKLQKGCTMYLYGAKIIKSEVSRNEYFDKRCYKFDHKVKPIDIIDLKVFVLTTLFPLSMRIFEDFSSGSSIYKVMFGLQNLLNQQQIDPSFMTLNKRIEKHLIQKKYNSMQQCLNLTVKLRKKMIIFIGTKQSFEQLTGQLITQLNGFHSKFMSITKLSLCQLSPSYDNTNFTHYQFQISFLFNQIEMKSSIDLLFCVPYVVSRMEIEQLKKKSGRMDSVIVWFEIPKADYDMERIQTYKEINYILSNCQKFYIPAAKKFCPKLIAK